MGNPLILKLSHGIDLDEDERAALSALTERTVPSAARHVIMRAGEPSVNLHLIMSGVAIRYRLLPDGGRQIFALLLPGDFCDLQAHLLDHSDHYIETATDCAIVEIPPAIVDDLVLTRSRLARALWWATLVDESVTREWMLGLSRRPTDKRMAHLFCEILLRMHAVGRGERDSCAMPLTQAQLADVLGITNIHVNRVLQELRDRDLIVLKKRQLLVPDLPRLQAFCDFDPGYLHLGQRARAAESRGARAPQPSSARTL
ncbi:Crp/Fnr family transcriptional regulator [Methylobacterium organophilum]|uniref:HTH crp-type domain-containing protein n=1 Tax=Methylobacterium organophilum TaxID=410 RepID=A0ABQ4TDG7_METOR|nr:Crp/Fnr family transcriptional regulator [Methylobacterium organophilum]GJE29111.1 hypothetical protein LKMONMHP_3987 [Methylobacterium organophilum]